MYKWITIVDHRKLVVSHSNTLSYIYTCIWWCISLLDSTYSEFYNFIYSYQVVLVLNSTGVVYLYSLRPATGVLFELVRVLKNVWVCNNWSVWYWNVWPLIYYLLYSLDMFLLVFFSDIFYNIFIHILWKCLTGLLIPDGWKWSTSICYNLIDSSNFSING